MLFGIQLFSESEGGREFCLAHFFTGQKFKGGVLGFAYVGRDTIGAAGGICSPKG